MGVPDDIGCVQGIPAVKKVKKHCTRQWDTLTVRYHAARRRRAFGWGEQQWGCQCTASVPSRTSPRDWRLPAVNTQVITSNRRDNLTTTGVLHGTCKWHFNILCSVNALYTFTCRVGQNTALVDEVLTLTLISISSKLDFCKGYWQVPKCDEDKNVTMFVTQLKIRLFLY